MKTGNAGVKNGAVQKSSFITGVANYSVCLTSHYCTDIPRFCREALQNLIPDTEDVGWKTLQTVRSVRDCEPHPAGKFYDLTAEEAPQSVLKISRWFCEVL